MPGDEFINFGLNPSHRQYEIPNKQAKKFPTTWAITIGSALAIAGGLIARKYSSGNS